MHRYVDLDCSSKFNIPLICDLQLHRLFLATGHITFFILMIYTALKANFVESVICFSVARFFHGFLEVSYQ